MKIQKQDIDRPFRVIMYLFGFFLALFVFGFLYHAYNTVGTEAKYVKALVVQKKIVEVPKKTRTVPVGKVLVPRNKAAHTEYRLCFELEKSIVEVAVEKALYESTDIGQRVPVAYSIGRMTKQPEDARVETK